MAKSLFELRTLALSGCASKVSKPIHNFYLFAHKPPPREQVLAHFNRNGGRLSNRYFQLIGITK
jgi:hypothetical protein